jgi:hypothetical protein
MTGQNCSITLHDDLPDARHELLRDAIEGAVRSTIEELDKLQVSRGQEEYTNTEVNWVPAHVIPDLIRFGPLNEEPIGWTNVEEFIRKLRLTNLDKRYLGNGRPPWTSLGYDPSLDNRSIPWFY